MFLLLQRMRKWYRTQIFDLFSRQSRRLITRHWIATEQKQSNYFYQKPSNSLDISCLLKESGLLLGECRGQFTPCSSSREWHMPWCRGLQVLPFFSFTKGVLPAVSAFWGPVLCPPLLSSECLCLSQRDLYCEAPVNSSQPLGKKKDSLCFTMSGNWFRQQGSAATELQETDLRFQE